jgi:2-iminobutanoate/2-iminopropanoate deaminase
MARKATRKPAKRTAAKTARRRPAPRRATRKVIAATPGLRPSRVPLSHAVRVGGLLFVSGTTPFAPDGSIARGDFAAQMHQVMTNIKEILAAGGSALDKVAKVNVILTRGSDFAAMNEIYRRYFREGNYPARTTIVCLLANPDFLLEIECVAGAGAG